MLFPIAELELQKLKILGDRISYEEFVRLYLLLSNTFSQNGGRGLWRSSSPMSPAQAQECLKLQHGGKSLKAY